MRFWLVLPGAQSEHDRLARVILLQCERHERADRVPRWLVLRLEGFVGSADVRCGLLLQHDRALCRHGPVSREGVQRRRAVKLFAVSGRAAFAARLVHVSRLPRRHVRWYELQ